MKEPMSKIQAVIFDLGGTLIEYAGDYTSWPDLETPGWKAAYDYLAAKHKTLSNFDAFRQAGFKILPQRWREATRSGRNLQVPSLLQDALAACGVEGCHEAILAEASQRYTTALQAQAWLMPGAVETVKAVKEAGFKTGLISNTMFEGSAHEEDLRRFGLWPYFDALLFSADVNKWKPNPEPFLHICEELDVAPETAVYVGDDPASDVVGGQRAGLRTVYVKSTPRFAKPNSVKPDAEINRINELIQILHKWDTTDSN